MIRSSSAPDAPASPSTPDAARLTSAWGASGVAARSGQLAVAVLAALLLLFIVLPLVALFLRTTPANLLSGLRQPPAVSALVLSLETTAITLALALALGTPAAYLLARRQFPGKRLLDSLVDLPIVVPPAVAGVALLMAFGRAGLLGPALNALGIRLPPGVRRGRGIRSGRRADHDAPMTAAARG